MFHLCYRILLSLDLFSDVWYILSIKFNRGKGGTMMGRDIHVVLEKKTNDVWEFFCPEFEAFDSRNYLFFDFINEICTPGCPPELKNKKLRSYIEQWHDRDGTVHNEEFFLWDTTDPCELYDFGYITLEELINASQHISRLWVSADFLEKFLSLGGILPKEMQIANETRIENSDIIGIHVLEDEDIYLRDYINTGISELKRIAHEHNLQADELRICFAFDC